MLSAGWSARAVPAGEIVSIDTSKAEALPGVKAVWTTDSQAGPLRRPGHRGGRRGLARDRGGRGAAGGGAATRRRPSRTELRDGHGARRARSSSTTARVPARPRHPAEGQRDRAAPPTRRGGGRGDIEKGFAEAEVVHEATYYCPVHTHSPPRDPRRRRPLGGRPAHGLRLDPGRLHGPRGRWPRRSASTARTSG